MKKLFILFVFVILLVGCKNTSEEKTLSTPTNLARINNIISFDEVPFATSYVLSLNDEEITITKTTYTIHLFGEITVKVKAQAEGYIDSPYTDELKFSLPMNFLPVRYNYSIHSSFNLPIYTLPSGVSIANITSTSSITTQDYEIIDNQLQFKSVYLTTLSKGQHEFTVSFGDLGFLDITISITQTELPYLISYNTVTYTSSDITFIYELFGGSIVGLTGNTISLNDYEISENTLTIHSSFIEQYFIDHPDETTVGFKYDLKLQDAYVFGYVFINHEE